MSNTRIKENLDIWTLIFYQLDQYSLVKFALTSPFFLTLTREYVENFHTTYAIDLNENTRREQVEPSSTNENLQKLSKSLKEDIKKHRFETINFTLFSSAHELAALTLQKEKTITAEKFFGCGGIVSYCNVSRQPRLFKVKHHPDMNINHPQTGDKLLLESEIYQTKNEKHELSCSNNILKIN